MAGGSPPCIDPETDWVRFEVVAHVRSVEVAAHDMPLGLALVEEAAGLPSVLGLVTDPGWT